MSLPCLPLPSSGNSAQRRRQLAHSSILRPFRQGHYFALGIALSRYEFRYPWAHCLVQPIQCRRRLSFPRISSLSGPSSISPSSLSEYLTVPPQLPGRPVFAPFPHNPRTLFGCTGFIPFSAAFVQSSYPPVGSSTASFTPWCPAIPPAIPYVKFAALLTSRLPFCSLFH